MNEYVFLGSMIVGLFTEVLSFISGMGGDGGSDVETDEDHVGWIDLSLYGRFLIGFGSTGLLSLSMGVATVNSYIAAILIGVGTAYLAKLVIKKVQSGGNPGVDQITYQGHAGVVSVRVQHSKPGEVQVFLHEKNFFVKAYSIEERSYEVGERVNIVKASGDAVIVKGETE